MRFLYDFFGKEQNWTILLPKMNVKTFIYSRKVPGSIDHYFHIVSVRLKTTKSSDNDCRPTLWPGWPSRLLRTTVLYAKLILAILENDLNLPFYWPTRLQLNGCFLFSRIVSVLTYIIKQKCTATLLLVHRKNHDTMCKNNNHPFGRGLLGQY